MGDIARSSDDLAAGTLAGFERTGDGCYLDNADADTLRAMVRFAVNHKRGAVKALRDLMTAVTLGDGPKIDAALDQAATVLGASPDPAVGR